MAEGHEAKKDRETLKRELLDGALNPDDFIKALRELDQATPDRIGAEDNLVILDDPQVKSKFENTQYYDSYCNFFSFTHFHIAQRLMIVKNDPKKALVHFEAAVTYARKIVDEDYVQWKSYAEGTLAYLNSDLAGVKTAFDKVSPGPNKNILARFIRTLEAKQRPNYKKDYDGSPLG